MQEQKQIIGIGCQMWGEWIPQVEDMYRMIYPYWAAHAETGWTDNKRKTTIVLFGLWIIFLLVG